MSTHRRVSLSASVLLSCCLMVCLGGCLPPDEPQPNPDIDAERINPLAAQLDWLDAERATSYDVYFDTVDPPATLLGNTTDSSWALDTLDYETTYYWQVVAKNDFGTTVGPVWAFTTTAAPTQPPAKPSTPSPADQATQVSVDADLDWADAAWAASYDVYFDTVNPPATLIGNPTSSSWPLSTLSYSTTYYWQVVARNDLGTTAGPVWSFTTTAAPTQPPGVPSAPGPADGATNVSVEADLDWADVARATLYDVYFGTANPPATLVGSPTSSNWALSTLSYSTTYYWKVVAKNTAGSTPGPVWSFTTQIAPPDAPASPNPANGATNVSIDADLDWADAARAASYDVYFDTVNPPAALIGSPTSSSWPLSTLSYNTTYFWQVVAKNSAGATPGPVWSFTTQIAPPDAPASPNPANGATNVSIDADLDWADAARATSYDVYFDTVNPPATLIGSPTSSSWPLSTLSYNTTYFWQVVAKNSAGATPGPVWSFTTAGPLADILMPRAPYYFSFDYGVLPMFNWVAEPSGWSASFNLSFVNVNGHYTYTGETITMHPSGNTYHFTFSVTSHYPDPFSGHLTATVNGTHVDEDFTFDFAR